MNAQRLLRARQSGILTRSSMLLASSLLTCTIALSACDSAAEDDGTDDGGRTTPCTTTTSTSTGDGGGGEGGDATSTTTGSTTTSTASGGTEPGPGNANTGNNTHDHMNDPGESGQKDPFEILKERAEEGPAEIRSRLHGCTKLRYDALGQLLSSRGVNLAATAPNGQPRTAGQLYNTGRDALGVARFDAREAEAYFHTTSGATKLFDIFIQAAPEVIANIQNAEACRVNGVGAPMFVEVEGEPTKCNEQALSCLMGRPAKPEDLLLCELMIAQHDGTPADVARKRNIAVATFLSAAHTCE
jgi:hypothetical protein